MPTESRPTGVSSGKSAWPKRCERRASLAALRGAIDHAPPRVLLPEHDVLFHAQVLGQIQFLVNHGHAGQPSGMRDRGGVALAGEFHAAVIGRVGAAEHLHQRAFAGAVLADQRQRLAGP